MTITAGELNTKANYQDFQRYSEVDLALAGDAEATFPSLIEAVKRLITDDRKRAFAERGARLADASRAARDRARTDATYAWDAVPISSARLAAEVWAQVERRLVARERRAQRVAAAPVEFREVLSVHRRLGRIGHRLRRAGGGGRRAREPQVRPAVGQPSERRRFAVRPGVLWTAAHHKIPDSVHHEQQPRVPRGGHAPAAHGESARARRRSRAHRDAINDPAIDFTKVAEGMGVHAEGPITNPKDLAPAIKRAIATVKGGEPALVDVVTQPR